MSPAGSRVTNAVTVATVVFVVGRTGGCVVDNVATVVTLGVVVVVVGTGSSSCRTSTATIVNSSPCA